MKLLPCHTPACSPLGALWPGSVAYPNGEPAVTGQYVREYRCERCRRNTIIGVVEYNRLPEISLEEFDRIGQRAGMRKIRDVPTRDWMAQGLSRGQAEDLFRAGLGDPNTVEKRQDEGTSLTPEKPLP